MSRRSLVVVVLTSALLSTVSPVSAHSGRPAAGHPSRDTVTRWLAEKSGDLEFAVIQAGPVGEIDIALERLVGKGRDARLRAMGFAADKRDKPVQLRDLNHLKLRVVPQFGFGRGRIIGAYVTQRRLVLDLPSPTGTHRVTFHPSTRAAFDRAIVERRHRAGVASFNLDQARRHIAQARYTIGALSGIRQGTERRYPGSLRVFDGICTGSGDGYCRHEFFFLGNTYLGTDTLGTDALVFVVWQKPLTVELAYPRYRKGDALSDPTGGVRLVRFHWNGQRLIPLDPLPEDPNS